MSAQQMREAYFDPSVTQTWQSPVTYTTTTGSTSYNAAAIGGNR